MSYYLKHRVPLSFSSLLLKWRRALKVGITFQSLSYFGLKSGGLFLVFSLLLSAGHLYAEPLSLTDLNRFNHWVQCVEQCEESRQTGSTQNEYDIQKRHFQCLSLCGPPDRNWEKDGARSSDRLTSVYPTDRHDLQLAILEFQSIRSPSDPANQAERDANNEPLQNPHQLICYGGDFNAPTDSTQESTNTEQGSHPDTGIEYARQSQNIVVVGTLCAYSSGSDQPAYACPYFELVDEMNPTGNADEIAEIQSAFQPYCNESLCALSPYDFSATDLGDFQGTEDSEVYYVGSYRPFICPEVVCRLYDSDQSGDLSTTALTSFDDNETVINQCRPSEADPSLPQWVSNTISDQTLCDLSQEGGSGCTLSQRCVYDDLVGRGVCKARSECQDPNQCPVAHLELKSQTDQEVIVWVHFDHSDQPVRVLDLHLNYPRSQMVLADARRLPALIYSGGMGGKSLTTTHLSDQTLRLSIFDSTTNSPIPYGPLVELVFQRSGLYGQCHDLNQNGYRDVLYNPNLACHQAFMQCDSIARSPEALYFSINHSTVFQQHEHQACFQALKDCIFPDDLSGVSIENLRLINAEREASEDENGDGVINAADQRYTEDANLDGWVNAQDCEDFQISFTQDSALRALSMAPNSDQAQSQLENDTAWGEAIQLDSRQDADVKLKVWYSFDALDEPVKFSSVPSSEVLCGLISTCANEPEEAFKQKQIGQLDRLQEGKINISRETEGIITQAAYLDGNSNHIQLPITFEYPLNQDAQSFSTSLWYFSEGNGLQERQETPQILFSHHNFSERTRFGVWLRSNDEEGYLNLEFFNGDYFAFDPTQDSTSNQPGITRSHIATIPIRQWQYLALSLDVPNHTLTVYHNGDENVFTYAFPFSQTSPIACPQFNRGTDLLLHQEGDFLGGRASSVLFFAEKENGLYKIKERDVYGVQAREVLGSGEFSYRDPDYNPFLDRLVYASNESGSYEIWISDGAGQNRQQVTFGFGETRLGISALSPKWAPDGSAIIFESNAFDVLNGDNIIDQVYHLYYIEYDARQNQPAIPLPNGETSQTLNYQDLLSTQSLVFYRLTDLDQTHHHRKARWMTGRDEENQSRGWVIYETALPTYEQRSIAQVNIDEQIPLSQLDRVGGIEEGLIGEEISLLDAHYSVENTATGVQTVERLFYKQGYAEYQEASSEFTVALNTTLSTESDLYLDLSYTPKAYQESSRCWDLNQNRLDDPEEDLDQNGQWNTLDCVLYEIHNLFLQYDDQALRYIPESQAQLTSPPQDTLRAYPYSKDVVFTHTYLPNQTLVAVNVNSPYNAYPLITASTSNSNTVYSASPIQIATLKFQVLDQTIFFDPNASDQVNLTQAVPSRFTLIRRELQEQLKVHDLNPDPYCWDLNFNRIEDEHEDQNQDGFYNVQDCKATKFDVDGVFEFVDSARFSPQGDSLILNVISRSRPMLIHSPSLYTAADAYNLNTYAMKIKGMSWTARESYTACNWIGGYLNPYTKQITASLRGGLDEVKYFTGLRNLSSIRSEFERGREWLVRDGRHEALDSLTPRCGQSHLECPPYHLCIDSECTLVECTPPHEELASDIASSSNGSNEDLTLSTFYDDPCLDYGAKCTLRPVSIEQELNNGEDDYQWVCSADCTFDRECYTQNCLNGPCLYCDRDTSTCSECRQVEVDLNGVQIKRVEGCPDERSFYCESGACLSECYSFEDDQSLYLCDPVTEYCQRGRCVLHRWSWEDLSPMTLLGASDAQFEIDDPNHLYTMAIGESYPLKIEAFGVSDYGIPPEMLVEVRGGPYYTDWFTLGRVTIQNRTQTEATNRPIYLDSVYPYTAVRMRLIQAPYQNVMNGASGLGELDTEFCIKDVAKSLEVHNTTSDLDLCTQRAQGSRFNMGYRVGMPYYEKVQACRDHGHAGCPARNQNENQYLYGGNPGVMIVEVSANGGSIMNALSQQNICSYEGSDSPVDHRGAPKKLFYGSLFDEESNQKALYNSLALEDDLLTQTTVPFQSAVALLNCNYYDPINPSDSVFVEFTGIPYLPPAQESGSIILDNGDQCLIEVDALRNDVCYEWKGGDVSFDPYVLSQGTRLGSYMLSNVHSFGHNNGFTLKPPPRKTITLSVLSDSQNLVNGLKIQDRLGSFDFTFGQGSSGTSFQAYQSAQIHLVITQHPNLVNTQCYFADQFGLERSSELNRNIPNTNPTYYIKCVQSLAIGGCIQQQNQGCSSDPDADGLPAMLALQVWEDVNGNGVVDSSLSGGTPEVIRSYEIFEIPSSLTFTFPPLIPKEAYTRYQVSLIENPSGLQCTTGDSGTQTSNPLSSTSNTEIQFNCEPLSGHNLTYQVNGLHEGDQLQVQEQRSSRTQTVSSSQLDESNQVTFPLPFNADQSYHLVITQRPIHSTCTLAHEQGMGGSTVIPVITCVDRPQYHVSIPVIGVPVNQFVSLTLSVLNEIGEVNDAGREVAVQVIDSTRSQTQTLNGPNGLDNTQQTLSWNDIPIYIGESYRLQVEQEGTTDGLSCVIVDLRENRPASPDGPTSFDLLFDENSIHGVSGLMVQCTEQGTSDALTLLEIGGTIEGLSQPGLRLIAFDSGVELPIEAGATRFTFPDGFRLDTAYNVQVSTHPQHQYCTVSRGQGRLVSLNATENDHVRDVLVQCESASSVRLELDLPNLIDRTTKLKAMLFSKTQNGRYARLVAQSGDGSEVGDQVGVEVDSSLTSIPLVMPEGEEQAMLRSDERYDLYIFIDSNFSSSESTNYVPNQGDIGLYRELTLEGAQENTLRFTRNHFVDLVAVNFELVIDPPNMSNELRESPIQCFVSSPSSVTSNIRSVPFPQTSTHPLIGQAARICTNRCDDSIQEEDGKWVYSTTEAAYVPVNTPFDVSCVLDTNSSDGLDRGDWIGISNSMRQISPIYRRLTLSEYE